MNLENQDLQKQEAPLHKSNKNFTHNDQCQDIASHQHLEHQLRKDKMLAEEKLRNLSTYLASNAHDLKTPFNVIMGYSQMFLDGCHTVQGNDFTKEYATAILASSEHLYNLVTDLIDLCNIDAQALDLNERAISVEDLIQHTVAMVQDRVDAASLTLAVSVAADLPPIFLDNQRITQAILNLLSNAIKFTLSGGQINLTAFNNNGGELEIHISDNGVGMHKQAIPRALVELGKVRQGQAPCTGLGLPLAKRLVELHGGHLELSSQLNRGTTIVLTLPAGRWQNHTQ